MMGPVINVDVAPWQPLARFLHLFTNGPEVLDSPKISRWP
jgi:hypothetical protein